jgi:cell division septation protein DedD
VNENNSKDANNSLQFTDIRLVHKPSKEIKIPTINSTDKFYIQLGSYKSLKEIDKSWNNLQKKHSTLLGDLSYITKKADLGDKGVFYRLQAGPFLAESSARTLCKKLKELEQDCLFVK